MAARLAIDLRGKTNQQRINGASRKPNEKVKTTSRKAKAKVHHREAPHKGRCNDCGKEGHKAKDCWSEAGGNRKLAERDSREATSLNHEPEKDAEAGGLDLCHLNSGL